MDKHIKPPQTPAGKVGRKFVGPQQRPSTNRQLPSSASREQSASHRPTTEIDTKTQEHTMEQANMSKTAVYQEIPIELIEVEANIRQTLDSKSKEGKQETEKIHELADSLKQVGQLEPILVYEKTKDNYVIITGHRRFAAAQYATLSSLKCIICNKPETDVDRLYIQAIENELREDILPADRERYITDLLNAGQTQSQISDKLGKSAAWISQTVKAKEGRDKFGSKFAEAKIELDTYAAYQIADAPEEAIGKAIQAIRENPKKRKAVFKELERSKPRTSNRGRPRTTKTIADTAMTIGHTTSYVFGYNIAINEDAKSVTIKASQHPNGLIQELYNRCDTDFTERITSYFLEKGYTIA